MTLQLIFHYVTMVPTMAYWFCNPSQSSRTFLLYKVSCVQFLFSLEPDVWITSAKDGTNFDQFRGKRPFWSRTSFDLKFFCVGARPFLAFSPNQFLSKKPGKKRMRKKVAKVPKKSKVSLFFLLLHPLSWCSWNNKELKSPCQSHGWNSKSFMSEAVELAGSDRTNRKEILKRKWKKARRAPSQKFSCCT